MVLYITTLDKILKLIKHFKIIKINIFTGQLISLDLIIFSFIQVCFQMSFKNFVLHYFL